MKKESFKRPLTDWLPITSKELPYHGYEELDVILVSGDAYVDHPSFGTAVVARIIQAEGLRIGIIPQPNWQDSQKDFQKFGRPKYFFGVTSGCMDSMINHYTAAKRRRSADAYTPGGETGFRPDYTVETYTQILKKFYPDVPIIIGGIEASLRRVTHYDYWSNKLKPSILVSSGADMLVYGMGEQPLREICSRFKNGDSLESMTDIAQTAFIRNKAVNSIWENVEIHSHKECLKEKIRYAANFKVIETESNRMNARRILQDSVKGLVHINPPYPTMSEKEIDRSFDLPYTRLPHPKYSKRGTIPAFEMIRYSVNIHRGCFGGCSFCTISAHQGKFIASRSESSILKEVEEITRDPDFKGYLSDVGGPSANMYRMKGIDEKLCEGCSRPSCIHPSVCTNLDTSHRSLTALYKKIDSHPAIKKAFVGSGIRYDLLVKDYNKNLDEDDAETYMTESVTRHVSGRLKVAPEHTSDKVLKIMRKPSFRFFKKFKEHFDRIQKKHKLKQQLIPYFISSHPGSDLEGMAELALETKEMGFQLEQVQDFTPTPMTVATVIYYSGVHPYTLKPVVTPKGKQEKEAQNKLFFHYKRENRSWLIDKLSKIGRVDILKKLTAQKNPAEEELMEANNNPRFKPRRGRSRWGRKRKGG